jgi:hypothetical protein
MNHTRHRAPAAPHLDPARPRPRARGRALAVLSACALTTGMFVAQAPTASAETGTFAQGTVNGAWVVPAGVTQLGFLVRGAQGQNETGCYPESGPPPTCTVYGGNGAGAQGVLNVTPGQILYFNVPYQNTGGAADIRTSNSATLTGNTSTDPRLVVAAGGGSAGRRTHYSGFSFGGHAESAQYWDGSIGEGWEYASLGGVHGTPTGGGAGGAKSTYPNNVCYQTNGGSGTPGTGGAGGACTDGSGVSRAGGRGGDGWYGGGGGGGGAMNSGYNTYLGGAGGGAGSSYVTKNVTWCSVYPATAAPTIVITY